GISVVTLADWSIRPLVKGAELQLLFTGRKTRSVYYASHGRNDGAGATTIFAADIDSGKIRKIATLAKGSIGSINADETLLLGQWAASDKPLQPDGTAKGKAPEIKQQFGQANYAANGPDGKPLSFAEAKEVRLNERLEAKIPME
ncbi:oligogalacturonate lyase, partial [Staphylococcus haemolyticus]